MTFNLELEDFKRMGYLRHLDLDSVANLGQIGEADIQAGDEFESESPFPLNPKDFTDEPYVSNPYPGYWFAQRELDGPDSLMGNGPSRDEAIADLEFKESEKEMESR